MNFPNFTSPFNSSLPHPPEATIFSTYPTCPSIGNPDYQHSLPIFIFLHRAQYFMSKSQGLERETRRPAGTGTFFCPTTMFYGQLLQMFEKLTRRVLNLVL